MTRAEILAIGDELVHGNALDTNSKHIARELEEAGLEVHQFTVTTDDPEDLRQALTEACGRARVVVSTGGLGPTEDDRTRDVVADLVGAPLELHRESMQWLEEFARRRKRKLDESNRRQAYFPRGADVLDNPVGTAPGFRLQVGDCVLFVVPGVPREMNVMMQRHVLPWVCAHADGARPVAAWNLHILGLSEAALGERVASFMAHDREPRVGVTAHYGLLTLRIVGQGSTVQEAMVACRETADEVRPLVQDVLACEGDQTLVQQAAGRLMERGISLATAESCTGGLLSAQLTDVAGISSVFLAGFVTYSDTAKIRDLLVPESLLALYGAVSEPVVRAMAEGAARRTGARLAVAITGIAGPDGGTDDKPVGTVCFGLCVEGQARAWTLRMGPLGRQFIRERAVAEALVAVLRETGDGGRDP